MSITDADRHRLQDALISTLGEQEAAILMEHLPPVGWADVATKTDLEHLRVATKADIDGLHSRFDAFRAETKAEFAHIRTEMKSGFDYAQVAMDARTELLRAEMSAGFATQLRWLIGTIIASYAVIATLVGIAGIWR